jgi:hypothetical protein
MCDVGVQPRDQVAVTLPNRLVVLIPRANHLDVMVIYESLHPNVQLMRFNILSPCTHCHQLLMTSLVCV